MDSLARILNKGPNAQFLNKDGDPDSCTILSKTEVLIDAETLLTSIEQLTIRSLVLIEGAEAKLNPMEEKVAQGNVDKKYAQQQQQPQSNNGNKKVHYNNHNNNNKNPQRSTDPVVNDEKQELVVEEIVEITASETVVDSVAIAS
jgi:hypothetical protein